MRCPSVGLAALATALAGPFPGAPDASAIEIVFDYTFDESGFFAVDERRAALEEVARQYAVCLEGDLAPLPAGEWIAFFQNPSGEDFVSLRGIEVPGDAVRVWVGAKPLLESNRLARGGPGHLRFPCKEILGSRACFDALNERGHTDWVRDWVFRHSFRASASARAYPPTDFAPFGGTLSFASDVDWHFGEEPPPAGRFDFASSALHELGHVLGIGTAESWGTYTPGRTFQGPASVQAYGGPVPLDDDLAHWAEDTESYARGVRQRAVFTAGLAPGERRLMTEIDCAALRDVGWRREVGDGPSDDIREAYAGWRIKGDVNGDGVVDSIDAALVRAELEDLGALDDDESWGIDAPGDSDPALASAQSPGSLASLEQEDPSRPEDGLLADPRAFQAADTFPMWNGNAVGDGVVDAFDLLLLEDVADDMGLDDVDGDGFATIDENAVNSLVWMTIVGRPRHGPMTRWTDACLAQGIAGPLGLEFLVDEVGLSLEFCSRDGSSWSQAPALSPEEALAQLELDVSADPPAERDPSGGAAAETETEVAADPTAHEEPTGGAAANTEPDVSADPPAERDPSGGTAAETETDGAAEPTAQEEPTGEAAAETEPGVSAEPPAAQPDPGGEAMAETGTEVVAEPSAQTAQEEPTGEAAAETEPDVPADAPAEEDSSAGALAETDPEAPTEPPVVETRTGEALAQTVPDVTAPPPGERPSGLERPRSGHAPLYPAADRGPGPSGFSSPDGPSGGRAVLPDPPQFGGLGSPDAVEAHEPHRAVTRFASPARMAAVEVEPQAGISGIPEPAMRRAVRRAASEEASAGDSLLARWIASFLRGLLGALEWLVGWFRA